MKKLIISLFLGVLFMYSFSQTQKHKFEHLVIPGDTITVSPFFVEGYDSLSTAFSPDTIKLIFLICDTTSHSAYNSDNELTPYYYLNVYWKFGYFASSYYKRYELLDEHKKPFNKNIVVWDYREIK